MTEEPYIDLVHLRSFTLGDETLEQELFGLFLENIDTYAEELAACVGVNGNEWAANAHKIKGLARGLGATRVADLCHLMEQITEELERARTLAELQKVICLTKLEVKTFSHE